MEIKIKDNNQFDFFNKKIEFLSESEKDTIKFAKAFAKTLKKGDILAFEGDLGAGKTTFTKGLLMGLESNNEAFSPTFTIMNEYDGKIPVYHFDMYRILDEDSLYAIGFYDVLDENGICVIEWSENIKESLPKNTIFIKLMYMDENIRKITVKKGF